MRVGLHVFMLGGLGCGERGRKRRDRTRKNLGHSKAISSRDPTAILIRDQKSKRKSEIEIGFRSFRTSLAAIRGTIEKLICGPFASAIPQRAIANFSLAVLDDLADLVVCAQIAERQKARLGVEGKAQVQSRAALEQATAQPANTEARMKMGSAEPVAHRGNHLPNPLPLRLWKGPKRLLQLRRKLNPQCPLRCHH
jgi:hypothetical protein